MFPNSRIASEFALHHKYLTNVIHFVIGENTFGMDVFAAQNPIEITFSYACHLTDGMKKL